MAERIYPSLSRVIVAERGRKDLARLFNLGGIVSVQNKGYIIVIPGAKLEIEVQPSGSNEWTRVELPGWSPLGEDLSPGDQVIIAANFGQGQQGKEDKATWRRQNVTTENATLRGGYPVTSGHRGGMRQSTSPAALRALFRRRPPRKYR